jgi:hypothetical protein
VLRGGSVDVDKVSMLSFQGSLVDFSMPSMAGSPSFLGLDTKSLVSWLGLVLDFADV